MRAPMRTMPFGRSVIASHDRYEDAQRTVDTLSDERFPVEHTSIVGSDLKMVESVRGRMGYGKAALSGLGTGAWFGLLIGLLFAILAVTPLIWLWYVVWGLVLGAAFGAVFGLIAHAATGGRRDFESVSQVTASRYDVMVDAEYRDRARHTLGLAVSQNGADTAKDPPVRSASPA